MLLQANDFRGLHEDQGVRAPDRRLRPVGQHHSPGSTSSAARRAQPAHGLTWPLLLRSDGTKLGKSTGARGLARPAAHQPVPVPPVLDADRRRRSPTAAAGSRSRPLEEVERSSPSTPRRRNAGSAQRALARELTALVHGAAAARRRRRRPPVSSAATRRRRRRPRSRPLRREVPDDRRGGRRPLGDGRRPSLVTTGLAQRRSARRAGISAKRGVRGQRGPLLEPATGSRTCRCSTIATSCCAGQDDVPPGRDFVGREVDGRGGRR